MRSANGSDLLFQPRSPHGTGPRSPHRAPAATAAYRGCMCH